MQKQEKSIIPQEIPMQSLGEEIENSADRVVQSPGTRREDCLRNGFNFVGKNLVALSAGFFFGVGMRAFLGAISWRDYVLWGDHKGTQLSVSNILSCMLTLALCYSARPTYETEQKSLCCGVRTPSQLARCTLRNGIPIFSGSVAMLVVKVLDIAMNGPDHVVHGPNGSRLMEVSDFLGLFALVIVFHFIDRVVLDYGFKWYADSFFHSGYAEVSETTVKHPTVQQTLVDDESTALTSSPV